jgi:hypothetical protein
MPTITKVQPTTVTLANGKKQRVECSLCYDEYGSWACLRPGHSTYWVKKPTTKAKIVQDDEKPVEKEVLATAIVQISEAVQKLYKSGLNRRAVVALIADDTKFGKGTIETVLDSIQDLSKTYTK